MRKSIILLSAICALALVNPTESHALLNVYSGVGESGLGSFEATFEYSYVDSTTGQIVVNITNTTPVADGGYITALAFNNPFNLITGITLTSTDTDFDLLGSPYNNNGVAAGPFGNFDIAVSIGDSFQGSGPGGGAPSDGIASGDSAQFTFDLTGSNLDTLTELTFFSSDALSAPPADGKGVQNFLVRYRGFCNGGSDKVPGYTSTVPEPASLILFGTGLAGAFFRRRFFA